MLIRHPNAIRPWQHVLEPLLGYLVLAEALYKNPTQYAESWNFGPNDADAKSVQYIVERMASHWGSPVQWACDDKENPHEAHYLKLDCSKAKARLNWQPQWSLDYALYNIVEWQQNYQQGADMHAVSLKQIAARMNHAII